MKILVFGKTGQVATELQRRCDLIAIGRDKVDFTSPSNLATILDSQKADIIINAAAYTDVERAEEHEQIATLVNGTTPALLANEASVRGIPFIHISTDYVFDGNGDHNWRPSDNPNPQNAYGRSKLKGEIEIAKTGGVFAILRTSWIFSSVGKNFVTTILELNTNKTQIEVISDQVGGPTAASDIAHTLLKMANAFHKGDGQSGIYHFAGEPNVSWADFARTIISQVNGNLNVVDVLTSEYPTKVIRPHNSRMDCSKLNDDFGIMRPNWQSSLQSVIQELQDGTNFAT